MNQTPVVPGAAEQAPADDVTPDDSASTISADGGAEDDSGDAMGAASDLPACDDGMSQQEERVPSPPTGDIPEAASESIIPAPGDGNRGGGDLLDEETPDYWGDTVPSPFSSPRGGVAIVAAGAAGFAALVAMLALMMLAVQGPPENAASSNLPTRQWEAEGTSEAPSPKATAARRYLEDPLAAESAEDTDRKMALRADDVRENVYGRHTLSVLTPEQADLVYEGADREIAAERARNRKNDLDEGWESERYRLVSAAFVANVDYALSEDCDDILNARQRQVDERHPGLSAAGGAEAQALMAYGGFGRRNVALRGAAHVKLLDREEVNLLIDSIDGDEVRITEATQLLTKSHIPEVMRAFAIVSYDSDGQGDEAGREELRRDMQDLAHSDDQAPWFLRIGAYDGEDVLKYEIS